MCVVCLCVCVCLYTRVCIYVVCECIYVSKIKCLINKTPDRKPISFGISVLLATSVWLQYDIQIIKQCALWAAHLITESLLIPGGGEKATSHEEVIYFLSINLCCEHMLTDITNTRRYLWRITFRTCTSGHTTHLLNEDGARICLLIVLCQEFYIDFSVTLQDSSFYNLREKGSMTLIKLSKDIHLVCYTAEIPPVQYLFNVLPLSIASR